MPSDDVAWMIRQTEHARLRAAQIAREAARRAADEEAKAKAKQAKSA